MNVLKYKNEFQFLNDFSSELKLLLSSNYNLEMHKKVSGKELDIFIENQMNGNTFTIEVKGSPGDTSLPPEIIPWLQNIKDKINIPQNHFIIISMSDVNKEVKKLFNQSNLEVFEYSKHKESFTKDFISFIKDLDSGHLHTQF